MGTFSTIFVAVLVFGVLILIHELGHYIFARIFGVKIFEFSIGMGPKLIKYTSKKTDITYAISAVPFGGYVAMAGEDGDSEDPNSFDKKPAWQRFIITVAGAAVNIIAGFIVMLVFTFLVDIGGTTIGEFVPMEQTGYTVSSEASGLEVGDKIIKINGRSVSISDELSYEIMRSGYEPVSVTVIRDGREMTLDNVVFPTVGEQGQVFGTMDFRVYKEEKSFFTVMSYAFTKGALLVRMCWESIYDLVVGRYTVEAISGPVGISSAIGDAAKKGASTLLYITALISINLGVMNLLPIPALDGGRLITILFEMVTRRRIPKHIEAAVNAVGLFLLLAFSFFIMIKDVVQVFFS